MSGLPLLMPWQSEPPVTSRSMLVGDLEIVLGRGGGMLGVKAFDAVQAGLDQRRE